MAWCKQCGVWFNATASWMTVCRPCYRAKKEAERDQLEIENAELWERVRELRRQVEELEARSVMTQEMCGRLIRLCHPDKHGNSQAANEATQWLLKQRR